MFLVATMVVAAAHGIFLYEVAMDQLTLIQKRAVSVLVSWAKHAGIAKHKNDKKSVSAVFT